MIALPPQMHVFVRDWLSANHVVLRSPAGNVVIDSGYIKHIPLTCALLASSQGLRGGGLALLVNTHCHSDHMGGNAELKRRYGCPIALPAGEGPAVEHWESRELLLDYAGQRAERFHADRLLHPGSVERWGDLDWQMIAAPGHDMGALVFYNAEHRILVSGDALWENGYGFVMPPEIAPAALPAARATLDLLSRLDVDIVIPGHGAPFTEVGPALERAYTRTASFEADSRRLARHGLKVMVVFTLLDLERMTVADLAARLEAVEFYREFNARFFGQPPGALAEALCAELERAGAIRRQDDVITPA